MANIFIGMETSGAFRSRFVHLGHWVASADLLPAEDGSTFSPAAGGHMTDDIFRALHRLKIMGRWPDLAIFHPDCTYLTNSAAWAFMDPDHQRFPGVGYHQRIKPGTLVGAPRRQARERALDMVRLIISLPIARKVVENPARGAIHPHIRAASQILQPYQCGDDASKGTGFWYFDEDGNEAPEMMVTPDPALRVAGRLVPRKLAMGKSDRECGSMGRDFLERWSNQTDSGQNRVSPGADRWKERSRTWPGLADVTSAHWHSVITAS